MEKICRHDIHMLSLILKCRGLAERKLLMSKLKLTPLQIEEARQKADIDLTGMTYASVIHNPQFHTGSTPVIEISNDGLSAKAGFIDDCWGNIGKASVYDEKTIERNYGTGTA